MIIDSLSNADRYAGFYPGFREAFEYINSLDLAALEPGKYQVPATGHSVSVTAKEGGVAGNAKFEAHNGHIDIQVCISGPEQMGWKPRGSCRKPVGEFNTEKDVIFYQDTPDMYFSLEAGQFAIFFPEDVHAPMIGSGVIKKMVVKIKV